MKRQTADVKRQTADVKRQTADVKRQTADVKRQMADVKRQMADEREAGGGRPETAKVNLQFVICNPQSFLKRIPYDYSFCFFLGS